MEAPTPVLLEVKRTTIAQAVEEFLKVKQSKSEDYYRRNRKLLASLVKHMASAPRSYQHVADLQFLDLVGWCSDWSGAERSRLRDVGLLNGFLKFCETADLTPKYLGDKLIATLGWSDPGTQREPFASRGTDPEIMPEDDELEKVWKALEDFPDEYGRRGQPIARQTEAFVLVMRYTGMDVSTTVGLQKKSVRGSTILTRRAKNGSPVWTLVPEWVIEKLSSAPHDSNDYFFWSGEGKLHTRASKWFSRLRKLLDLAQLPHRTPHNFRHHFAIEHLMSGTPIEEVSRLLGHKSVAVTEKNYNAWIEARQRKLGEQQRRVWANDPQHRRMTAASTEAVSD